MKKVLGLVAAAALFATPALADPLAGVYGKIITISDAEGAVVSSNTINPDNTFTTTNADGSEVAGTWELSANDEGQEQFCFTSTDAEGTANTQCTADLLGKQVGDSYQITQGEGEEAATMTVAISEPAAQ